MSATVDALEHRLFQLETLYEIGRECASAQSIEDAFQITLSMVMGAFGVLRGLAFAGDPSGTVVALQSRGFERERAPGSLDAEALARIYLTSTSPDVSPGVSTAATNRDSWLGVASLEVCLPFALDETTYGALALGARLNGAPYSAEERALLQTIVSNAAVHLRQAQLLATVRATANELEQKVRALSVINEIALGITNRPGASRLYRFLVERIASAVEASLGALFIPSEGGNQRGESIRGENDDLGGLTWRTAAHYPPERPLDSSQERQVRQALALKKASEDSALRADHSPMAGHEVLVPIRYGAETLGALWLCRDSGSFGVFERDLLGLLANEAAVVLENSRLFDGFLAQQQEQFRLRGVLEQYLAPSVAERVLSGDTGPLLAGTHVPVSIVRVDMRGSTQMVNAMDVDAMVELMNQYFSLMTDILFRYEGTIDRFDGDAVVGFFGAPESHPDDSLRAVRTGLSMLREFESVLADWRRRYDLPEAVGVGVGIATGDVVVGNIGSAKRLHYTVSGPTANLAARLMARAPKGVILMDQPTWNALSEYPRMAARVRTRRPRSVRAKGFADLVPVYRLCAADVAE